MHMADALLSPAVGAVMYAASAGAVAYSVVKVKKDEEKKLPIMAVAGAFVFAAQMINFTIPGTGSSGHIGGGMLLASVLGGPAALLTITAVLLIQCLFFADGGLLALGCNIFNMGVIPCLLVYPLLLKPFLRRKCSAQRLGVGSGVCAVVGLELGAFCVVLETVASGIAELPFGTFTALMLPIHLAIGAVEGVATAAILCFVYQMRPELIESAVTGDRMSEGVSVKRVVLVLAICTALVGGGLSLLASAHPDGLEWSIGRVTGGEELTAENDPVHSGAAAAQEATAVMPDYDYAGADGSATGTSVAGLVGAGMTCVLAGGAGFLITRVKKRKRA